MKLAQLVILGFTVLALTSVPWLAPRNTLFGVRTGVAFRSTDQARRAIAIFVRIMMVAFFAGLALVLWSPPTLGFGAVPLLAFAVFICTFVTLNRRLKPFAVGPAAQAQIDLAEGDRMPATKWLSIIPVGLLASAALYLRANWAQIPDRFPVHWGLDGQPNRWATRTPTGVYGVLIAMGALLVYFILLNAALWHGTRRSQIRRSVFHVLIVVQFALAVGPSLIALSPLLHISPLLFLLAIGAPILLAVVYASRKAAEPIDPTGDNTPESAWSGGLIYFNRQDPALAVPRRDGFGVAPNFAHPMSWLLLLAPPAIGVASFALLK